MESQAILNDIYAAVRDAELEGRPLRLVVAPMTLGRVSEWFSDTVWFDGGVSPKTLFGHAIFLNQSMPAGEIRVVAPSGEVVATCRFPTNKS